MSVFKKQDRKEERQPRQETVTPTTSNVPETDKPGKTSVVGKTLFVKGTVSSDEEVFILGKIEGTLNIKNRVVVGKSGVVNADIEAREVVVQGTVNGNVNGSYKVEVVPDGVLNGNIISQRVVLAEGAIFKGNIDMTVK